MSQPHDVHALRLNIFGKALPDGPASGPQVTLLIKPSE